jgi:hypothetical protein
MDTTEESEWKSISGASEISNDSASEYDNFYSPENRTFYARSPYKNLDPIQHQIRLLKLLPLDDGEILSFTLLDNCVLASVRSRYTALSYCAGDPLKTDSIRINGLQFNAFANLAHALKEVVMYWRENEKKAEEELLWVDQICINQSNPKERSHQVAQMRDIYAGAERVLISLALKSPHLNSAQGIEWMMQLRQRLQDMSCKGMRDTNDSSCYKGLYEHMVESFAKPNFQDGYIALIQLLQSPWWRRAWIYQEFIVASEANFLHGGVAISWQDFATVMNHLIKSGHGLGEALSQNVVKWFNDLQDQPSLEETLHRLSKITGDERAQLVPTSILIQRKFHWKRPADLKVWLECGRLCRTSDPRDKVYAFLGLARECYNITPDYSPSNTVENLLIEVAQKIVTVENTLNLLFHVGNQKFGTGLPSWVPNWDGWANEAFLERLQNTGAIFPESGLSLPTASIEVCGTALRAEGIKIDKIPGGLWRSALRGASKTFSTMRGLSVEWLWRSRFGQDDCVWCFPGSSFIFVLRPERDHWLLLYTPYLQIPENDSGWATNVTKLIQGGDFAGLLEIEGLKKEIIEIH